MQTRNPVPAPAATVPPEETPPPAAAPARRPRKPKAPTPPAAAAIAAPAAPVTAGAPRPGGRDPGPPGSTGLPDPRILGGGTAYRPAEWTPDDEELAAATWRSLVYPPPAPPVVEEEDDGAEIPVLETLIPDADSDPDGAHAYGVQAIAQAVPGGWRKGRLLGVGAMVLALLAVVILTTLLRPAVDPTADRLTAAQQPPAAPATVGTGQAVAPPATPVPPPAIPPPAVAAAPDAPASTTRQWIIVQPGETTADVARRAGVEAARLRTEDGAPLPAQLFAGQLIELPSGPPEAGVDPALAADAAARADGGSPPPATGLSVPVPAPAARGIVPYTGQTRAPFQPGYAPVAPTAVPAPIVQGPGKSDGAGGEIKYTGETRAPFAPGYAPTAIPVQGPQRP